MADRRIAYGVLLAATVILYIFYEAFWSWYLLLATLLCPVLSLLLSLPAMRRVEITVSAPDSIIKGHSCEIVVDVSAKCALPYGKLLFLFEILDSFGRDIVRSKDYSLSGYGGSCLHLRVSPENCGVLEATVTRGRVTDLLGLFSRKLAVGNSHLTLVLPVPEEPDVLPPLPEEGPLVAKPGGGFAEDYDIRAYRPGDAVRSIHWKLSAKTDEVVVRDALVPQASQCEIALALGGTPSRIDKTLAHLAWVSAWLTAQERPHCFYWYDVRGAVCQQRITNPQGLDRLIRTLLLADFPETARYPAVSGAFCLDAEEAMP